METRHEDSDGSDIFWPGYVDATTNLILNLLFLLTILIVAVFMFALELGRTNPEQAESARPPITEAKEDSQAGAGAATDLVEENIALKREIKRLNMLLARRESPRAQAGSLVKSVDATAALSQPRNGLDKTLASDGEIIVRFEDEAVGLTPAEHDRLLEFLPPVVEGVGAIIYVEVPAGFSEAKRMGFYRAMTVRNLLIEMKMPTKNIEVSVVERENDADASLVRVRPR
ncbi:MAG: hypothetical protein LC633_00780 [Desulfobulbaceae bacterium]|nr:hypothetical protein [Desulfobulbaceae bacterium]